MRRTYLLASTGAMVAIDWFEGSRAALADLFEPADDSRDRTMTVLTDADLYRRGAETLLAC